MSSLDAEAPLGIADGALGLSQARAGVANIAVRTVIATILFILLSKVNKIRSCKASPRGAAPSDVSITIGIDLSRFRAKSRLSGPQIVMCVLN
jgi:hypothetical protein